MVRNLIALSLLVAGCERDVSLDLPRESPKLVVNAFFTPDSLLQVQVSRSQSVLERPAHHRSGRG
jgi:hypothetical protein